MKRAWLEKTHKDMYKLSEFHEWTSSSSKYAFEIQQVNSNLK